VILDYAQTEMKSLRVESRCIPTFCAPAVISRASRREHVLLRAHAKDTLGIFKCPLWASPSACMPLSGGTLSIYEPR